MYQPLSIVDMKCLSLDYETMVSFRTKEECNILKYIIQQCHILLSSD